jgi:hypothetical protein
MVAAVAAGWRRSTDLHVAPTCHVCQYYSVLVSYGVC